MLIKNNFKKVILLICILVLLPLQVFAEYEIVTDNRIVIDNKLANTNSTLADINSGVLDIADIEGALDGIKLSSVPEFRVHIIPKLLLVEDLVLGITYKNTNDIVIFDLFDPYSSEMAHNVVTHEVGHIVYNSFTEEQREQYKFVRDIPCEWDDTKKTDYINQPNEIFAEDFRILFGTEEASLAPHMNMTLGAPRNSTWVRNFISITSRKNQVSRLSLP